MTGRLVAGLSADLVVIDADPFADGPDVLLTARPLLTVVAGQVGHAAQGSFPVFGRSVAACVPADSAPRVLSE
ncbi:hypothetical protein [Nocardioides sp. AN3]